jgi:hypothetical protein
MFRYVWLLRIYAHSKLAWQLVELLTATKPWGKNCLANLREATVIQKGQHHETKTCLYVVGRLHISEPIW